MSHTTQLPKKIRKVREIKGYSQEYMALKMEMSQRQYKRIENGEVELNMSKLDEICKLAASN